jgi:hypothetical protein
VPGDGQAQQQLAGVALAGPEGGDVDRRDAEGDLCPAASSDAVLEGDGVLAGAEAAWGPAGGETDGVDLGACPRGYGPGRWAPRRRTYRFFRTLQAEAALFKLLEGAVTNEKNASGMGEVIRINEARIRDHLGEMVRGTVEEALNAMLDGEADRLCNAGRYECSEDRRDMRAGS